MRRIYLGWALCAAGAMAGAVLVAWGGKSASLPDIPPPASVPGPAALPHMAARPYSKPVRITIPAIGVSAPITPVGLNRDGTLQVPPLANHDIVGWYDRGPAPGQDGPAVIVGHVDTYLGPSVFFRLHDLRPGDQVKISGQRGTVVFTVSRLEQVSKSSFPTLRVYGPLPYPALRLVTCGGPFDTAQRQYAANVIAYAVMSG